MCGIAAEIRPGAAGRPDPARVDQMLGMIGHRGDAELAGRTCALPGAVLGCNRLAIVDRESAAQPMSTMDGSRWVAFNGEIYNHEALQAELRARGHRFATRSDTEVLLHGYLEWGRELPAHLDGMFAFVLYDAQRRAYLCARDPLGVKPLYWATGGAGEPGAAGAGAGPALYLASELKCFRSPGLVPRVFPPGHVLADGCLLHYHAEPGVALPPAPAARLVAEFGRRLDRAVRKRVQTDLPIAVIFSGGVDSAAVLALAARHHPDVTAITVGFPDSTDVEFASRCCRDLGIRQVTRELTASELVADLPRRVWEVETFETVDVMDVAVMAPAFEVARDLGIKVALVGDGSDELLAGYDLFRNHPDPAALMRYRVRNLYRTDLQRVDRVSMARTVEARVPFLDRDVVDLAWRLPLGLKHRYGAEKWILRRSVRGLLPDYLTWRPKVRMPEGTGLRYQLLDHARRQPSTVDPGLLDRLGLHRPDEAYFLGLYLAHGFPVPVQRYKRVGWDFGAGGYFTFAQPAPAGR